MTSVSFYAKLIGVKLQVNQTNTPHMNATKTTSPATSRRTIRPCECGCGEATRGGHFRPGHDAKLRKELVGGAARGLKRPIAKLKKLGWAIPSELVIG